MAVDFRVLSFNIFKFGSEADPGVVLEKILELEPDVMGFQEVFNTKLGLFGFKARNAKRILEEGLAAHGYHTAWAPASGPGPFSVLTGKKFHDGLMLAARTERWDFDPDADHMVRELPKKGFDRRIVHCLVLKEKGGGRAIAVCNTHLTVGTKDKIVDLREQQTREILGFLGEIEGGRGPVAAILVGDFNAQRDSREIDLLVAPGEPSQRCVDTWAQTNLHSEDRGITYDLDNTIIAAKKKRKEAGARIDFIFLRPDPFQEGTGGVVSPLASRVVLKERDPASGQNLSDHYGVLTEFRLA